MRNYVIINGVSSLTIEGLAINIMPPITKPLMRNEIEEIDGRDGDIITELGYSAYDKEMEIGLYGNFDIDAIIKYFTGEGTVIFSTEPDKYYNFKILDQIDYDKLLKFRTATVVFHCQPFKYPTDEEPIEVEPVVKTGEGETITIDDTFEGNLQVLLKGNTYQDSTTGANLQKYTPRTYSSGGNKYTCNSNGQVTITGTATSGVSNLSYNQVATESMTLEAGTYVLKLIGTIDQYVTPKVQGNEVTLDSNNEYTFTLNETTVDFYVSFKLTAGTHNSDFYITLAKDTATTERYTNGASPNPDYPQEVHTVSGDNEVEVVGSNLFSSEVELGSLSATGGNQADNNAIRTKDYIEVKPNTTYTINNNNSYYSYTYFYDENKTFISSITGTSATKNPMTFTTPATAKYVKFRTVGSQTQNDTSTLFRLNYGSTSLPYQPYQSTTYPINLPEGMELCKIGDYKDRFFKTIEGDSVYDSLDSATKQTLDSNEWYLEKKIGKVVLNGTETTPDINTTQTNTTRLFYYNSGNILTEGGVVGTGLCNRLPINSNSFSYDVEGISCGSGANNKKVFLRINKSTIGTTAQEVSAWLGNNNIIFYYCLETPTYTKIEGTLASQLEEVYRAKSEEGQTNISQTNDDLPFWISATITFTPPSTINNIGNIYAKPILTITGSGNVGVVLNGIEILQINLGEGNTIAIDVPNLEAYNPNDNTLMNRLVTGDYMKLLIQEGNNSLSFDGDVTSYSMTNYTRWI